MNPGKIYGLISKVSKDLGAVGKGSRNEHQKYNFRGIDQLYNAIQPILVSHGVFCVPQVLDSKTETLQGVTKQGEGKVSFHVMLKIAHRFYADDGSYVESITFGEGLDTSDKAANKAMSAAMKYAFIETFSIPTEDIADSDSESPDAGSSLQKVNVHKDFF